MSRQSSGGKSLFSRSKLHKEKPQDRRTISEETVQYVNAVNSASSSRSSRHGPNIDRAGSPTHYDELGLSAGVLTAIPYDMTPSGSRSPVAFEHLQNSNQIPVR